MKKDNQQEFTFTGGQMQGLPVPDQQRTARPRAESVPKQHHEIQPHTPQHGTLEHGQRRLGPLAGATVDESMRLVTFGQLETGACFMREIRPNTFMTYTKTASDKSWDNDYQVLIFKRHEKAYLKPDHQPHPLDQKIDEMAAQLREYSNNFVAEGQKKP